MFISFKAIHTSPFSPSTAVFKGELAAVAPWIWYKGDGLVPLPNWSHQLQKMTEIWPFQDGCVHNFRLAIPAMQSWLYWENWYRITLRGHCLRRALSTTSMYGLNTKRSSLTGMKTKWESVSDLWLERAENLIFSVCKSRLVCEEQGRQSCSYSFPGQNDLNDETLKVWTAWHLTLKLTQV